MSENTHEENDEFDWVLYAFIVSLFLIPVLEGLL